MPQKISRSSASQPIEIPQPATAPSGNVYELLASFDKLAGPVPPASTPEEAGSPETGSPETVIPETTIPEEAGSSDSVVEDSAAEDSATGDSALELPASGVTPTPEMMSGMKPVPLPPPNDDDPGPGGGG